MALIFVPGLSFLVFLSWQNHLLINLLCVFASITGTMELNDLLEKKGVKINKVLAAILGSLLPLVALTSLFYKDLEYSYVFTGITILVFVLLARQVFFGRKEEFNPVLLRASGYLFLLVYPGLFLFFFIQLAHLPFPSWKIFTFLFMVYGNDSFAYLSGILFGKNSPKPFLVSPNKSWAGFIGGSVFSTGGSVLLWFVLEQFYPGESVYVSNWYGALIIGLAISATSILGDLFESAIKRSAKAKDSGTIIIGRGGMLDSIDSVLFSVPVYYSALAVFGNTL
jgi:phosphatidate cytidylyltransferase